MVVAATPASVPVLLIALVVGVGLLAVAKPIARAIARGAPDADRALSTVVYRGLRGGLVVMGVAWIVIALAGLGLHVVD
jgi:hypothetical protein